MATEVGIISALIGTATATATDGTVRNLQVGEKVYPNEIITTGLAGAVEVEFTDGSLMDLGRNSQAVLDNETFDFDNATPPAATADSDVIDDIEAIQQALLEGADPTAIADPTAAGPGAQPTSEGGSDAVVVDYLAPRVTPQAGFDTTGPGVSFPDPPPFQFLVDDSDDSLLPPGELPPESLNTPPVADPVLTSYQFAADSSNLSPLPSDSYVFQQFSVGGGVDESEYGLTPPSVFEIEASLGGDDAETTEADLVFTLTKLPSFGDIYRQEDDGSFTKLELNDTFEYGEAIFWSANQTQFNDYLGEAPITTVGGSASDSSAWSNVVLIAKDLDGNIANIAFEEGGIGVAGGTIVPGQLEHRDGKSESIEVKFSGPSTAAVIHVDNLIGPEREVGQVEARLNGVVVGTWLFTSSYSSYVSIDGTQVSIDFSLANKGFIPGARGEGSFELPDGIVFDTLVFTATNYGTPGNLHSVDSSDYFIKSIEAKTLPPVDFEYKVTDEGELDSEAVVVTIKSAATEIVGDDGDNTLTGSDGDNIIIGGAGNDILTGGAGEDIFVWNAGDEGTAVAPAHDIVTDFNVTEGDVLDFSDILVGEESGDLTDFISITEDGADIVIALKPDANDVTQVITLQGTSLADFGMGGYDIATQQADIIKRLVQDGHVNVDS